MTDRNLFDAAAAEAAAVEGADRAYLAAAVPWKAHARETVLTVGRLRRTFTADDVAEFCTSRGLAQPDEPRAWGTVFRSLAAAGYIAATGEFVNSRRVTKHAAPTRVWTLTFRDVA